MAFHIPFFHLLGALGIFLVRLSPSDKILSLAATWKAQFPSRRSPNFPEGLPFPKAKALAQLLSVLSACRCS